MNIKRKGIYFIGTVFVTIGLLSGCGSSEEAVPEKDKQVEIEEPKQQQTEEKTVQKEKINSKEVKNNRIIDMTAFEFGYTPPTMTLEKGKEYTLILKNEGEVFHDLNIKNFDAEITYMSEMGDHPPKETSLLDKVLGIKKVYADGGHGDKTGEKPSIHMNANSGQTVKIKFIPKETGEFKFYCSVPGHEEAGMHGQLEVNHKIKH
jgi:uncharacterized cupredoxin-like copper-binding protein